MPQIQSRRMTAALTLLLPAALLLGAATPSQAIVMGSSSSLGSYTVRLVGPYFCSGVAIASRYVVTAAHCANRRMRVMGGGGSVAIAGVSHSVVLDDGRRVSVSGDAAILKLAEPLSFVSAAPVGYGEGDSFTIAGYGTTDESARGAFGALHEASLVAAPGRQLVDPRRSGALSASACFGDSGGPVMRGGTLVGVITRANYPNKRIACGFYTRWAPVTVRGEARTAVAYAATFEEQRPAKRTRHATRTKEPAVKTVSLFESWFAPKLEARKTLRRRSASR